MKNQPCFKWSLVLLMMVLPLAGGCLQQAASAPDPKGAATNNNNTVVAADATNAPATEPENLSADGAPAIDISEAAVKAVATEKPVPANVRTNGPAAEIAKLAESGLEESVLLAYVTNSPSMFSLSAEEIIYLSDIGVSSTVVTAMLQHDQALKATNVWGAAPVEPATNETASAAEIAPQQAAAPPPQEPAQEVAPAPEAPPTQSSFYQSLAPYGTWVDVDGYGLVWQPTVVVMRPSWRPYYDNGRWVYSDYGWYWVSDYSWGWAPFHYGRWFQHHRLGWCWYPGYHWGPSWVTWRYTDGYCGWAPLPPCAVYRPAIGLTYWGSHVGVTFGFGLGWNCYSFVSWNHFHGHHYHKYQIYPDHARRIYHDSVASTRIVGNRSGVFNHGLSVDRVSRATRTEVQRVAVRETGNINGRGMRGERLSPDGKSLTVYRPRFPEGNSTRLTRTEPFSANRSVVRNLASETAPQGALKPVPTTASRVERPAAGEIRRAVPATSLASSSERPNRLARVEPVTSGTSRGTDARVSPTMQRPALNPLASRSEPPAAGSTRTPVAQAPRPGTQTQAARPTTAAPTTAQRVPEVAQNWPFAPSAATPSARNEPVSRSPWATTRQSTPPTAQASPPARPQRSYNPPAQSAPRVAEAPRSTSVPAAPRYTPAPSQPPAQRYTTTPTPSYEAPARVGPRFNPPAYSAPTVPQRSAPSYQAPTPSYQAPAPAPSRPSYQAPAAPSYQAPARSYTPAPAPAAPSYSAPSRPSPSQAPSSSSQPSSSGESRGGRGWTR